MFDEQKPSEHELSGELSALERQLRGMTPVTPRIDRDRLMFAAGRAAEEGPIPTTATSRIASAGRWFWPAATACMTAATLLLATMLVWQNQSQLIARQMAKPPIGRDLGAKRQAVTDVVAEPVENEVNSAYRLVGRDGWTSNGPPTSGYLGVRYIALTAGVAALPTDRAGGESEPSGRESKTEPATARGMLEKMMPAS